MSKVLRGVGWLLVFLVVQISISVVLKIAAAHPHLRVGGTVLASAMPILSTYLLMRVFAYMPSHLAQGLGMGLGFVGSQFAMAAVAHVWLTPLQIAGSLLATLGMFLLSMPARKAVTPEEVADVAGV
jgi:hypothetical protein